MNFILLFLRLFDADFVILSHSISKKRKTKREIQEYGKRVQTLSGDVGAPLCQRAGAYRSSGGGLHPVRHLHALSAPPRARRAVDLRQRRARRGDHDQGAQGGGLAQGDHRPLPQPHQAFVRTARHVVRHLFAHLVARPCPNGVGFLPQALRRGQVRREDLRAVLRRGGAAVSGRPLHRGHLSPLPERKGLRRPVREVRIDAFARRTDRTPQRVVRFAARQARDQALVPAARQVRGISARVDSRRAQGVASQRLRAVQELARSGIAAACREP